MLMLVVLVSGILLLLFGALVLGLLVFALGLHCCDLRTAGEEDKKFTVEFCTYMQTHTTAESDMHKHTPMNVADKKQLTCVLSLIMSASTCEFDSLKSLISSSSCLISSSCSSPTEEEVTRYCKASVIN